MMKSFSVHFHYTLCRHQSFHNLSVGLALPMSSHPIAMDFGSILRNIYGKKRWLKLKRCFFKVVIFSFKREFSAELLEVFQKQTIVHTCCSYICPGLLVVERWRRHNVIHLNARSIQSICGFWIQCGVQVALTIWAYRN